MLRFRMCKINTEQFAILKEHAPENDIPVSIQTHLQYKKALDAKRLACDLRFVFEASKKPFLVIEVCCEFDIYEEDWEAMKNGEDFVISKETQEILGVHTVGTARGILHCKTEGTEFNQFIIPPINLTNLIKGDIKFKS